MNSLDSRHLRLGDTFAYCFTRPGRYRYAVGVRGFAVVSEHDAKFEIVVADEAGSAAPRTEYVKVAFDGAFGVDRPSVSIHRGDVVLWSTSSFTAPGFAVFGSAADVGFDSSELHDNSIYSHAFGAPGEIEWADPREFSLHGTIIVQDQRCRSHEERAAYMKRLREPTLITLEGREAQPSQVQISVGQTVFFAVRSGDGVAIVDRQLLAALNPQPLPPGPPPEAA